MDKIGYSNNGLTLNWNEVVRTGVEYFRVNFEKRGGGACLSMSDFLLHRTIGTGGFGRVVLASDRRDQLPFAIKILDKALILEKKQVAHVLNEKRIMQGIKFPFLLNLVCFFMDKAYIYFVMPFLPGGDLYSLLERQEGRLSEGQARFYVAQIAMSLEFLHLLGIAYRDLKPENVLLDVRGYTRLTDLGFCKVLGNEGQTFTICGTPDYLAPEVIACFGYGLKADMWSLGVLLWELCAGTLPFSEPRESLFSSISAGRTGPRPVWFSPQLDNLLEGLIKTDPTLRLGSASVSRHPWFDGTRWAGLLNKTEHAPFVPKLTGPHDASYYQHFQEIPLKTQHNTPLDQQYFADF